MVLLDLDTKGDQANQIEALFDYALIIIAISRQQHDPDSFPSGI